MVIQYRKCGIEIGKYQETIFGKKRKSARFIYILASKFYEDEGRILMRLCLQYAVINFAPRIGKYINKLEFYRQCHPRRVKDTKMSEIQNTLCVRNILRVTPGSGIERKYWGSASILRGFNDGVYICTCNVKSDEYKCLTKHAFFYDSHFKPLHQ